MMLMGDRVPMFKLRPYWGLLIAAGFILVIGGLFSAHLYTCDDRYGGDRSWLLVLIGALVLAALLTITAFSRYRFEHLRHHRPGYKRG